MNNRTQQRFDRSIREAVAITKIALSAKPARPYREPPEEPRRLKKGARMVMLLDPETGGTVLVPSDHPLALAKARRRQVMTEKK